MSDDDVGTESGTTEFRSVSQLKDYEQCPWGYKLKRRDKVWQKPAAWFPQGTAVHAAVEEYERWGRCSSQEQLEDYFLEVYDKEVNDLLEETPNTKLWFRSGPYGADDDIPRRRNLGLEQIGRYIQYNDKRPKEIIWFGYKDGEFVHGVELPFETEIGGVPVRGIIDQIRWDEELEEYVVVDVKSGNTSGDETQLGVYALAMRNEYGLEVDHGYYWMGKTGKATFPLELDEEVEADLAIRFGQMDAGVEAGLFPAIPTPENCRFCTVNDSCEFAAVPTF